MEAPALNPTIGVQSKAPIGGLVYKKDSSRPGGGVFIAQGNSGESLPAGVYISDDVDSQSEGEDSPSPPHVDSFNDESSSSVLPLDLHMPAPAFASNASAAEVHRSLQLQDTASGAGNSTIVNMMSMGGNFEGEQNVNPAMNSRMGTPGNVQVMNVLDVPQASNTLEQFAMADFGLLEGIPGGMFDWGKPWTYRLLVWILTRVRIIGQWDTFFSRFSGSDTSGGVAALQQHQQRLREMGAAAAAQQVTQQHMSGGGGLYPPSYSGAS